eukprot:scaffold31002_cov68-Phaeocystis_antarctica.AAC.6
MRWREPLSGIFGRRSARCSAQPSSGVLRSSRPSTAALPRPESSRRRTRRSARAVGLRARRAPKAVRAPRFTSIGSSSPSRTASVRGSETGVNYYRCRALAVGAVGVGNAKSIGSQVLGQSRHYRTAYCDCAHKQRAGSLGYCVLHLHGVTCTLRTAGAGGV